VKKFFKFTSFALIIMTFISKAPATAANSKVEVKAPCRLEVDYAHLSSGKLKLEGRKYVKVKARSICTVPQRQVTITLKIMKLGEFYDHEVRMFQTNPLAPSSSGMRVEMNNALVRCKDKRETYYFGVATSKAIVGGQWVYAGETYSINPKPIKCGT
jgi:hypothetical protein